jgi:hypothetical protein
MAHSCCVRFRDATLCDGTLNIDDTFAGGLDQVLALLRARWATSAEQSFLVGHHEYRFSRETCTSRLRLLTRFPLELILGS